MTEAVEPCDPASLARRYGPLVFRAAYRVLGDSAHAEDVQQEVFLRLLESRCGPVESWAAYLAAAATRMAIDVLRRQQRWWGVLPKWKMQMPTQAPSAEQAGIETQRARQLRHALATLTRREAQCFALRYLEGLEIAEVAATLQLKENNVSVTLHRARRRLEAQLTDATGEVRA